MCTPLRQKTLKKKKRGEEGENKDFRIYNNIRVVVILLLWLERACAILDVLAIAHFLLIGSVIILNLFLGFIYLILYY